MTMRVYLWVSKKKNIDRFDDRTAGVLAAPQGLVESLRHSLRCSLVNHLIKFYFSFGKAMDGFSRLKVLGPKINQIFPRAYRGSSRV